MAAGLGVALVPALGYTPQEGVVATRLDAADAIREVHVMHSPALLEAPWGSMREALHRAAAELAASAPGIRLPR